MDVPLFLVTHQRIGPPVLVTNTTFRGLAHTYALPGRRAERLN
jgi:hypothetical protein